MNLNEMLKGNCQVLSSGRWAEPSWDDLFTDDDEDETVDSTERDDTVDGDTANLLAALCR